VIAGGGRLFAFSLLKNWTNCETFYLIDERVLGRADTYDANERASLLAPWKAKMLFLRMAVSDAGREIPQEELDFVYVNVPHASCGCEEELEAYWPKVKGGGILAGNDYIGADELVGYPDLCDGERHSPVKESVDAFAATHGLQVLVTYRDDRPTWIMRKPP